jgi:hypothetical protein
MGEQKFYNEYVVELCYMNGVGALAEDMTH